MSAAGRNDGNALFSRRSGAFLPAAPRKGAAMIVLLAAMAVTMIMFLAAVKLLYVQRKTAELNVWQAQADWLAESGVQRTAARLAADANYRGETWNIPAAELSGRDGGTVAIQITPTPDKPEQRTVHVEADYPADPQDHARAMREVVLPVPQDKKK